MDIDSHKKARKVTKKILKLEIFVLLSTSLWPMNINAIYI